MQIMSEHIHMLIIAHGNFINNEWDVWRSSMDWPHMIVLGLETMAPGHDRF
jgi:hypothetical protein